MRDGLGILQITPEKAREAAAFFRTLTNQRRLMILCHLSQGECSVTELSRCLGIRQANISQQLARLREEGLVKFRRDGKLFLYSLVDPDIGTAIELLCHLFSGRESAEMIPLSCGYLVSAR